MAVAEATKIPKEPKELSEPVRYLSQKLGLSVTLRMPRRIVVDGRDVRTPGLRAKFTDGEFTTWKSNVVELMDGLLTGRNARRWNAIFQRAPSNREVEIMAGVAKRANEAKKRALEEAMKAQPKIAEKFNTFNEFNKRRIANLNKTGRHVTGTRSLGG